MHKMIDPQKASNYAIIKFQIQRMGLSSFIQSIGLRFLLFLNIFALLMKSRYLKKSFYNIMI